MASRGTCYPVTMQLLEYEAKQRAQAAGLVVPRGHLARSAEEATAAASTLGHRIVIKAQVPTGGRGKAGGIVVTEPQRAGSVAASLIGTRIAGHTVGAVLVEEYVPASQELYLAVTVDEPSARPLLLLGLHGGVDVNQNGTDVARVIVPLSPGLHDWHVWQAARIAGASPELVVMLRKASKSAFRLFLESRAELVEINPLVVTPNGEGVATDVRIVLGSRDQADGSAISRANRGFDYVELDPRGFVGLITTGAGASMVLVDLLADAGLRPINFCDIRSGSFKGSADRLVAVLRELKSYPTLTCVGVNIFAGITDLQEFADLLVVALDREPPGVPTVVRLEGPGAQVARERLRQAGLPSAGSLGDLIEQLKRIVPGRDPVGRHPGER
jgi:succinyl-CoA synthetase beta subunit